MRHEIGERRTLWITIPESNDTWKPWRIEAELGPCHGGTEIGWWQVDAPSAPLLLVANAEGEPIAGYATPVFFSESEALAWCITRMREHVERIQQRITEARERGRGA